MCAIHYRIMCQGRPEYLRVKLYFSARIAALLILAVSVTGCKKHNPVTDEQRADTNDIKAHIRLLESKDTPSWKKAEAATAIGEMGHDAKEAVAPLMDVIHKDPEIVSGYVHEIITALGKIGAPAVPPLEQALESKNAYTRLCAAMTLQKIGKAGVSAVPKLIAALDDKDYNVKIAAAEALGEIGPEAASAVHKLIKMLAAKREVDERITREKEGPDTITKGTMDMLNPRRVAAQALGGIGKNAKNAVPALLAVLKEDPNSTVRYSAGFALREIAPDDSSVISGLLDALFDPEACDTATLFIMRNPHKAGLAVERLKKALDHNDKRVRRNAVDVLKSIGDDASPVLPTLIATLKDRDVQVRRGAIEAIANIGTKTDLPVNQVVPAALISLKDNDAQVRALAVGVLQTVRNPKALPFDQISRLLDDPDPAVRTSATKLVARLGPAVRLRLIGLTEKFSPEGKAAVAATLAKVGIGQKEIDSLIRMLQDPNWEVRASACKSLAEAKSSSDSVVPHLERALDDESGAVVQTAIQSLGSFGKKAVPLLVHVLEEKKGHARVLAAESLGKIGSDAKEAIPALQTAKGDLDCDLSKAASSALAVIKNVSRE